MKTVLYLKRGSIREHFIVGDNPPVNFVGSKSNALQELFSHLTKTHAPERAIALARKIYADAQPLPSQQQVSISITGAYNQWDRSSYRAIARKLQRECSTISTTVGEIIKSDAIYDLTRLPDEMVSFPGLKRVLQYKMAS